MKTNFLNQNIGYAKGRVVEWDMRDAGMSVIRSFELLPQGEIDRLEALPKKHRAIAVGVRRRDDREFSRAFGQGMRDVVHAFVSENAIPEDRIISVKNDAVYIVGKDPEITRFWLCEFVPKNAYTSFVQLSGKEFYLRADGSVDCKGLGGEVEEFHRDYMISLVGGALRMAERSSPSQTFEFLRSLRRDYLRRDLEPGYYREMNAGLSYRLTCPGMLVYGMDFAPPDMGMVDIGYNYTNFVVELIARMI